MDDDARRRRVAVQLLPDWTASSVDPRIVRLDAIVKVPLGTVLAAGVLDLFVMDEQDRILTAKSTSLDFGGEGALAGPAWTLVQGGLLKVPHEASHACAVLNEIRSPAVARRDADVPLLLRAIERQVGVTGEPHLWWRFYNRTEQAVAVNLLLKETMLLIDERRFSPPAAPYNGPAHLPARRAMSGVWSLDDFDPRARTGSHRFQARILGEASEPIVYEWEPDRLL